MANVNNFWQNLTKFNDSIQNFESFYDKIQFNRLFNIVFFLPNSIQKSIQNFEIGCIQFNKIFIQLGNAGIDQGYIGQAVKVPIYLTGACTSSKPNAPWAWMKPRKMADVCCTILPFYGVSGCQKGVDKSCKC